jgi:hypothetical protein
MEKIKEIRLETLKNRERTQNIVNFNVNSQFTKKAIETNEAIETK